jgi:hypothetical protein
MNSSHDRQFRSQTWLPTLQAVEQANARILVDPQTHRYQRMMPDNHTDDQDSGLTYISRCDARIRQVQAALAAKP